MERWFSIEIRREILPGVPKAAGPRGTMILVPKRLVKLASERNRIRRVLREAVRLDPAWPKDKNCFLKVIKKPTDVDLRSAQAILKEWHA